MTKTSDVRLVDVTKHESIRLFDEPPTMSVLQ